MENQNQKLDNKHLKILNLVLEHIPYYGEFDITESIKRISNKHYSEIVENLTNPTEQPLTIKHFLVDNGYAIKRNDIKPEDTYIELKERGRWLKEQGSMESYHQYQVQKRQAKIAQTLEADQRNKRDKNLYRINFCIAISTGVAALYYLFEILNHLFCIYPY